MSITKEISPFNIMQNERGQAVILINNLSMILVGGMAVLNEASTQAKILTACIPPDQCQTRALVSS